jgi:hypothetical protein
MNIVGKTVICTTIGDTRFLKGENVLDAFKRDYMFGKDIKIFFDDNTYMRGEVVEDPEGDKLIGFMLGTWKTNDNNEIEVLT